MQELAVVMRQLGMTASQEELQQMMSEVDQDGNGLIDFDEFLGMMRRKMKENENSIDDVKAAFKVFDQNGDGSVFTSQDTWFEILECFLGSSLERSCPA